MTIRLSDVAAACGVDRSTASRALRNDPLVNANTAELIRSKARELGYRPHPGARALRTGRTGNVLMITGSFQFLLEQEAARELALRFREHDTDLYLATHQGNNAIYRRLLEKASHGGFDGVVVIPGARGLPDRFEETLYAQGLPLLFLDRYPPGSKIPVVTTANRAAATSLTEHVVAKGARRLLFCMNDYNEVSHTRIDACLAFAEKHGIPYSYKPTPAVPVVPAGDGPIGIVGITQSEVLAAINAVHSIEPGTGIYGAGFDSWIGSPAPAREVFVAVQDFARMAVLAAESITTAVRTGKAAGPTRDEVPIREIRTITL